MGVFSELRIAQVVGVGQLLRHADEIVPRSRTPGILSSKSSGLRPTPHEKNRAHGPVCRLERSGLQRELVNAARRSARFGAHRGAVDRAREHRRRALCIAFRVRVGAMGGNDGFGTHAGAVG